LDGARHDEAVDHFTAALNSSDLSSKSDIHEIYEDLVVVRQSTSKMLFITESHVQLFGWDLKSLWLTAHQKRCQAFLSTGKVDEALESHKYIIDNIDKTTKVSCLDWCTGKSSEMLPKVIGLTRISHSFKAISYQRRHCLRRM
jgi:hypothetical protein